MSSSGGKRLASFVTFFFFLVFFLVRLLLLDLLDFTLLPPSRSSIWRSVAYLSPPAILDSPMFFAVSSTAGGLLSAIVPSSLKVS
jgi:hypothetical protein